MLSFSLTSLLFLFSSLQPDPQYTPDTGDLNVIEGASHDSPVLKELAQKGYECLPDRQYDHKGRLMNASNVFSDEKAHLYDCWLVPHEKRNKCRAATVYPPAEFELWTRLKDRVEATKDQMSPVERSVFRRARNWAFQRVSTDHWPTAIAITL
jgi:hypothetical protein